MSTPPLISSKKNKSTQVHLRNGEFLNIDIAIPNNNEQQQIGDFFMALYTTITLHRHKLNKLIALKQACLNEMFI